MTSPSGFWVRAARLASFSAFLSALYIYSPNVAVVRESDSGDFIGFFAEPFLVCALVCSLVAAVMSFRGARARKVPAAQHPYGPLRLLFAVGYLVACGGFVATVYLQPSCSPALLVACAVVGGACIVPVCAMWARSLDGIGLRGSMGLVAAASGLSSLVSIGLGMLAGLPRTVLCLLLLFGGLLWPLVRPGGLRRDGLSAEGAFPTVDDGASEPAVDPKAFLSVMGTPLLGMAISSFAMGVQPAFLFGGAIDAQHLGMLVAFVASIPLVALGTKGPLFSLVYQLYIPASAAVVLVLCAFPTGSFAHDLGLMATYAFYSLVSVVAIASACAIANAHEFPRTFVFATLIAVFCGMGMLGIVLGRQVETLVSYQSEVVVVLTALYGCLLLLGGCVRAWRQTLSTGGDRPPLTKEGRAAEEVARSETFEQRIERLREEHGLSPRETQILGYVGRGHSSVYVAKTLLISESTVYTHMRNIYRKLDVSHREELIQLINGYEEKNG